MEHFLTEHRDLCKKTDNDADGGRSSSSLQPLEPALETPVTDMADTKVVCGGPCPSSVSRKSKYGSYCALPRMQSVKSKFPVLVRSNKVDIQAGSNIKCTSTDPTEYPYMPPLSQIDNILLTIQKNHIDGADFVLDCGSYSVETITLFKIFHAGKDIQEKVRTEIEWARQQNYLTLNSVSHI